MVSNTS